MSWPRKLTTPISISAQANQIGWQLAQWAEPMRGRVKVVPNLRHLWEEIYGADETPTSIVCYMGETNRGTPGNDTHRVDRQWMVVFIRGRGLDHSVAETSIGPNGGEANSFLDDVETVRDRIRVILSISDEFPVLFKSIKPMPNLAPSPSSNAYLDAYALEFTTANDIPAITETA